MKPPWSEGVSLVDPKVFVNFLCRDTNYDLLIDG